MKTKGDILEVDMDMIVYEYKRILWKIVSMKTAVTY